jgi:hypothetical protein
VFYTLLAKQVGMRRIDKKPTIKCGAAEQHAELHAVAIG